MPDFGLNLPWRTSTQGRYATTPPFIEPGLVDQNNNGNGSGLDNYDPYSISVTSPTPLAPVLPPPAPPDDTSLLEPSRSGRELQNLLEARQRRPEPSGKRRFFGGLVGGWIPSLGREIADPGYRRFTEQAGLLAQRAKLEDEDLNRRIEAQRQGQTAWNQRWLRFQAYQDQLRKQQEAEQGDLLRRSNAGEVVIEPEPFSLSTQTGGAPIPSLQSPDASTISVSGPDATQNGPLPDLPRIASPEPRGYHGLADIPVNTDLTPSKTLSVSGQTRPVAPQGYYQVPSPQYTQTQRDMPGSLRVKPTAAEVERQKRQAAADVAQAGWVEVSPDLASALPSAGIKPGQKLPPAQWEALVREANPERSLNFGPMEIDDNGDGTRVISDLKTGQIVSVQKFPGIGKKYHPPAAIQLGDTTNAVQQLGDRVLSGEISLPNAFSLLGGVRGGQGPKLIDYIAGQDSRILPTKTREGLNNVNIGLGQIDTLEEQMNKVVNAKTPAERAEATLLLEGYADTITARLARANGEVGVLTDQDVGRAKSLLAGWKAANFNPDYARKELELLRKNYGRVKEAYTKTYFDTVGNASGSAAPSAASAAPASATPAQRPAMGGYKIGTIYGGQKYLGGDPNDPASWGKP